MKKTIVSILMLVSVFTAQAVMADVSPSPTPTTTVSSACEDDLKSALAEFVRDTTKSLGQAKQFAIDQAPDTVKQYLMWQVYNDKVWAWIEGIVGGIFLLIGLTLWSFEIGSDMDGSGAVIGTITFLFAIGFGISMSLNIMDMKKVQIAPKVYVLEYVKALAK